MKRVLLFIDALVPGGAERQITYLAAFLSRAGYRVTIVTFYDQYRFYESYLKDNDVEVVYDTAGKTSVKRVIEIVRLVKRYHPQAVIAYKDGVSMAASMARALRKFNLIVSERNTTQRLDLKERLKFRLYRFADHIVPNSYSQAAFIENHYPRLAAKMKVITNMVDTGVFYPSDTAREQLDVPVVLTTARVLPQKNVLTYLDAVSILKKEKVAVRFLWYGKKFGQYYDAVKRKVSDLGLDDMIEFRDASENVADVYRSADIYCLPSVYEGFPNVVCEAMACGLPVACSDVCDNPDIVKDGVNGFLFDPADPNDIARKIRSMLVLDPAQRAAMSRANVDRIRRLCSPETFVGNYIALFKK